LVGKGDPLSSLSPESFAHTTQEDLRLRPTRRHSIGQMAHLRLD
jgi:hypothetical protein